MIDREHWTQNILVADGKSTDLKQAEETLRRSFPDAQVSSASSFDGLKETFQNNEFDIVVLDLDLSINESVIELLYRFKTENHEPSVVVLSRDGSLDVFNELYKHGCHRCIEKDERWLDELGGTVDSLLRWRKASRENLLLRAKLTETNMLLHEKNKRLDEFSASVAHDVRGPLGGISMKLEYLLDTYGDDVVPRHRDLLQKCLLSTERLMDLVQAMYEYARLGPQAAKMEAVPLSDLIQEVLEDMPFKPTDDIRVEIDELPIVYANPDLLRRVFVNLVNNAVRYNDKKFVQLKFRNLGIQKRVLAPFCEFAVEDNGKGIAALDLKDVFSMFVRAGSSEGESTGMGVGLAVVKRIIDLHYGTVEVESEVGVGTTFRITLPLEPVGLERDD